MRFQARVNATARASAAPPGAWVFQAPGFVYAAGSRSGIERSRTLVAWQMALATTGATGPSTTSPQPCGGRSLSISAGDTEIGAVDGVLGKAPRRTQLETAGDDAFGAQAFEYFSQ